jgi:hypothetical protein
MAEVAEHPVGARRHGDQDDGGEEEAADEERGQARIVLPGAAGPL